MTTNMDEKTADSERPKRFHIVRPLTRHHIYSHIIPFIGCSSYYALSLHCSLQGGLIRLLPITGLRVINSLLFNSHIGIGLYLYTSAHIRPMPTYNRIMFSAFGSVIFNFGSILLWATTKALLPDKTWIRVLFSMITSYGLLTIAKEYIETINKLI